ncbi:MAG: hypothetical protein OEZ22_14635 [Spirochaetia bacterium]|nr:hypothetical protein [Spirochaetia bacterium]
MGNKKKEEEAISINQNYYVTAKHKDLIIEKGDIDAYKKLDIAYLEEPFQGEFLYYAMIMANKYDHPQAYYDVYLLLVDIYRKNINDIDENTANLAIEYLLKAYNKNHHQARGEVEDYSIRYDKKTNRKQIIKMYKSWQ